MISQHSQLIWSRGCHRHRDGHDQHYEFERENSTNVTDRARADAPGTPSPRSRCIAAGVWKLGTEGGSTDRRVVCQRVRRGGEQAGRQAARPGKRASGLGERTRGRGGERLRLERG